MKAGIAALVVLVLSGCTAKTEKVESRSDTTDRSERVTTSWVRSTTTAKPADASLGTPVTYRDGAKLIMYSYEQPASGIDTKYMTPDPAHEFGAVDVEFCGGTQLKSYNPYYVEMVMADNTQLETAYPEKEPSLTSGELEPDECSRGWVTFKVPVGQRPVIAQIATFSAEKAKWRL